MSAIEVEVPTRLGRRPSNGVADRLEFCLYGWGLRAEPA